MRGLVGLWLWGGLEKTRGKQHEGRGLGWQEFDEEELSRWRGRGVRARGQRAGGGSSGPALEVKWVALCSCL